MNKWSHDTPRKIAEADDLHIAPFREDGETASWVVALLRPYSWQTRRAGNAASPRMWSRLPLKD
jgi:hypothetical protein